MANLIKFNAKICLTVSGCLIHEGKTLLVKHKKVKFWLCPGGHIDENELPHQAAEREFWEETGVKVRAMPYGLMVDSVDTEQVPSPFASNLHWVSQKNYRCRMKSPGKYQLEKEWKKGCEQHFNMMYLVEPVAGVDFRENVEETDGIAWFSLDEVLKLDTHPMIKTELKYAFGIISRL